MTPAALLLHGFTHTGSSWDPVVAALGERYRVAAPDIRGHGAASSMIPVSLEAVIGDLAALRHEVAGTVRIGMVGTTARWLAPHLLQTAASRHPKLYLVVVDGISTSLEPQLATGQQIGRAHV